LTIGYIDTETRSAIPIAWGNDVYTADAECMIVTYALDDEPVQLWDRTRDPRMPDELDWLLDDASGVDLIAQNAPFDRRIIERSLKRPTDIRRWRCTKAQALSHGLPGSLDMIGRVLGLSAAEQKMGEGKNLIQVFCIPYGESPNGTPLYHDWRDRPAEWDTFCKYAVQDTATLRLIHKRLPTHNYRDENLKLWHVDQLVNERGFGFDMDLAISARKVLQDGKAVQERQANKATDGAVQAATQRARLLKWFNDQGLPIPNMKAATIREWLESDDLDPVVRFMLELRLEASKSSGAKYTRGINSVGAGGRIRYTLQFNGAGRTGRHSGRGFQPHSLARPGTTTIDKDGRRRRLPIKWGFIDQVIIPGIKSLDILQNPEVYGGPNEACANALRGAIIAGPGSELVVADWSNIESRVLAWLASETWKLEAYRAQDRKEGVDLYKLLFHNFFGTPIKDIDDNQRQSGKVSELAFGFGGGVGALVTMAAGYEMDLDPLADLVLPHAKPEHLKKAWTQWRRAFMKGEDYGLEPRTYVACDILKQVYRASNTSINTLRNSIDDATKAAIKMRGTSFQVGKCLIWSTGDWLIIQLPSGRRLLYAEPKIETSVEIDPETGKKSYSEFITYRTARGQSWMLTDAWSGLFLENIVQSVANDILRAALIHVHESVPPVDGLTAISLHVHDEITCEVPAGTLQLKDLIRMMTTDLIAKHQWMRGLPLAAAGWVGGRYRK
jgi:DNA polymerase